MNRKSSLLTTVLALMIFLSICEAQNYVYISMNEHQDDQANWLSPGSYEGWIHSNDEFTFGYLPLSIQGMLTSSADQINYANGIDAEDVELPERMLFDMEALELPELARNIRGNASPWISGRNGQIMTWIRMLGEGGIDIYQYPRGTPREDSLYEHVSQPNNQSIFVDGDVEIEGTLYGMLAIGCSGNMYLLDNVTYENALLSPEANFNEDQVRNYLTLCSEGDIIIADTEANGQGNGYGEFPDNPRYHSIYINGCLIALGGSLRFEHENNEGEPYQGPTPDNRGILALKGMLIQRDGRSLWNENHEGTGYICHFRPDNRFFNVRQPPYFDLDFPFRIIAGDVEGDKFHLETGEKLVVQDDASVSLLDLDNGAEVRFLGGYNMVVLDYFHADGDIDDPVQITYPSWHDGMPRARIILSDGDVCDADLFHLQVEAGVDLVLTTSETTINRCAFDGQVTLSSSLLNASLSEFHAPVRVEGGGWIRLMYNLFSAGLTIDDNPEHCEVTNCTVANFDGAGIELNFFREVTIRNTIVAGCAQGIVNNYDRAPLIEYCDVWGNLFGNFVDCEPGEGCLSLDPLFVDAQGGDYHLQPGSPCIDAGDPDSPNDPDDSRADMGAFAFDHEQAIANDATTPSAFALSSPFPNPFNSTTTIGYSLPAAGVVSLAVYDLSGREVALLVDGVMSAGTHEAVWVAEGMASGCYTVQLRSSGILKCQTISIIK